MRPPVKCMGQDTVNHLTIHADEATQSRVLDYVQLDPELRAVFNEEGDPQGFIRWHNQEADMDRLSKAFPGILLEMHCIGRDGDQWRERYRDGVQLARLDQAWPPWPVEAEVVDEDGPRPCPPGPMVIEHHYADGDIGAHDITDDQFPHVAALWAGFATDGKPSHLVLRAARSEELDRED